MRSMVFIFIYVSLSSCSGFVTEALHDRMNPEELGYYFQTNNPDLVPEYEIVYLPTISPKNNTIYYTFGAFKRPINLKLQRNEKLLRNGLKTVLVDGSTKIDLNSPENCNFIHENGRELAAISSCDLQSVQGLVVLDDASFEIHPLTERLRGLVQEPLLSSNDISTPHIIKRATNLPQFDESFQTFLNEIEQPRDTLRRQKQSLTLELGLFFDEAAYKIFSPFFNNDKKLQEMLLAYINAVQALYYHPSLGTRIDLVLVHLEIMRKQPRNMNHYNGERSKLLDSFCEYQSNLNPKSDEDLHHWDMALYVSGLDFYAHENGRKSGVTMGLATVGGVCLSPYNCLIAELGTTNVFGKPYPSAGFTSVYILAHEIGHNLGMHHDSVGNSCPKDGYVMSPSRGTNGETQWSKCSADVASKLSWAKCLQDSPKPQKALDHSKFLNNPGQFFTAKRQCEILLRDRDAVVAPHQELTSICYNLQCKTPHRSGYYFAGPALEGTQCGNKKYCYGGDCVSKSLPQPVKEIPGGWGEWKETPCNSGCLQRSVGFRTKKRDCNSPIPKNTDRGCEGPNIEFGTCKDDQICTAKRTSAIDYASSKCEEFAKVLPELDSKGGGLQAPHEEGRVWVGCAIFCRHSSFGGFYTPRLELNDLGLSPYFPDGTWCHQVNNINYYCLHHHCLPENFQFTKNTDFISEDIPFSQNAHSDIPPHIKSYFSLGPNGEPLKTEFKPHEMKHFDDEEWETKDYVIVPELEDRF